MGEVSVAVAGVIPAARVALVGCPPAPPCRCPEMGDLWPLNYNTPPLPPPFRLPFVAAPFH